MNFLIILGISVVVLLLAVLGMAVRVIFVKGSEVRGGCAGKNPMLAKEGVACAMCGALPNESCKEDEVKASTAG